MKKIKTYTGVVSAVRKETFKNYHKRRRVHIKRLNKKTKVAISLFYYRVNRFVNEMHEKNDWGEETLHVNEGVLYALDYLFDFNEYGNCLGFAEPSINELLQEKYFNLAKLKEELTKQ